PFVYFEEDFESGNALWFDNSGLAPLTAVPSGGEDGGAYVSTTLDFENDDAGDTIVTFRAEAIYNSSGFAYAGEWIDLEVEEVSFFVRHDAAFPINFFSRFSPTPRFPGGIAVDFAPVLPNVWTEVTFAIDPTNPQFVSFEGQNFNSVFTQVGNIQPGISVPAGLAGSTLPVTFDLDSVTITRTPEPSSLALLGLAASLGYRRRRSASAILAA
ncbi:MAG: PEP-CTERM sorting domain-containing protein, partial [Planctomycetota bacterium]